MKGFRLCILFLAGCTSGIDDKVVQLQPFSTMEYSLQKVGLKGYKFDEIINNVLEMGPPHQWEDTGINKEFYLDMMEKIVRLASDWVDEHGAVIDPYFNKEFGQTTPRFVSSASILLYYDRIQDLKETVFRAMTYSCSQLANNKAASPDFWMRELTTAYGCLEHVADQKLLNSWKELIKQVNPESTYTNVDISGKKIDQLHNWAVYSSGGEYVREVFGLTPSPKKFLCGEEFFEKYMEPQLSHFTEEGMYRDPNDPITYDITTRLQIANALAYGYNGNWRKEYNELLRRGGLTTLLFTSSNGIAPYGGRSGQFQYQEAIIAALCELEAIRYKSANRKLSGAFKRQAHLSASAIKRWLLDMNPFRHIKNGFPPESEHGIDGYGKYSVYSLYCASVLGLAAIYADDEIKEYPCPSEVGGFLIELYPAFHKIFATVQGSHIEIDTQGDLHYESTGLGRFHSVGVPIELGLNMSFSKESNYKMDRKLRPENYYAIGPVWTMNDSLVSLAGLSNDLKHVLRTKQISNDVIEFDIEYSDFNRDTTMILQNYKLSKRELNITSSVSNSNQNIDSVFFIVPILVSDGNDSSEVIRGTRGINVKYKGHKYEIQMGPDCKYHLDTELFANRNGIYQNLVLQKKENPININLKLITE